MVIIWQKVSVEDLDRISVRAISAFRKLAKNRELFLDIVEDGVISEDEMGDLKKILSYLDELERLTQDLKVWVRKNL